MFRRKKNIEIVVLDKRIKVLKNFKNRYKKMFELTEDEAINVGYFCNILLDQFRGEKVFASAVDLVKSRKVKESEEMIVVEVIPIEIMKKHRQEHDLEITMIDQILKHTHYGWAEAVSDEMFPDIMFDFLRVLRANIIRYGLDSAREYFIDRWSWQSGWRKAEWKP